MAVWPVTMLALIFVGVLFLVANWGECSDGKKFINRHGGIIYSLSLAVYCTSWTYYGTVGTAVNQGWHYISIYLGPALVFVFCLPFLRKLLHVSNKHNAISIADFISSRYGKRRNIALLVSLICLFVVVPYIALQLKAVTNSFHVMLGFEFDTINSSWYGDGALPSAIAMAFFAGLFGTRNPHLTEQNKGIILAVAFESLIKIIVLILLASIIFVKVLDSDPRIWSEFFNHATESMDSVTGASSWISIATTTMLGMAAVVLLPRQFHVAFVANVSPTYLQSARKWFTSYLIIVTVVVIPISMAGMSMFPGNLIDADNYVLLIPTSSGWGALAFIVFIGGFAAATSMIIIATLALSTMLSNDVIIPVMLKGKKNRLESGNYSEMLLPIRRATIALVMALSWLYYVFFAKRYNLAETGLLTFALVIQLAPATIGALYWRKGNAWGVYAGLSVGTAIWFYTLMLPQLVSIGLIDSNIVDQGLLGFAWLNPQSLFNVQLDSLSHGVLFSLGSNIVTYICVSLLTRVPLQDRLQAAAFVTPDIPSIHHFGSHRHVDVRGYDLLTLLDRFIGTQRSHESINEFNYRERLSGTQESIDLYTPPDPRLIKHVEYELTGVIGASSASTMVSAVLERGFLDVEDVVTLFDDTSQAIQFSRKILFSTLEHLSQGISVVDRSLNLVAWNRAYLEMFDYPSGLIKVGRPISDIIRFNAERGLFGFGSIEEEIEKRVSHLRKGEPYVYQRKNTTGRVVEIRGNPIPDGGFVTSFTDVTDYNNTVNELAEAKSHLEVRVKDRTRTISIINQELIAEVERRKETETQLLKAKADAEAANASKTRFLALASHDILQPLNAARLFTAALAGSYNKDTDSRAHTLTQLESSLNATEELISTLLEIAQLDDGKLKPSYQAIELDKFLTSLQDEYSLLAEQKGIELHTKGRKGLWISTDATYLRRILQNILSNAVKYTASGRILLSYKLRRDFVLIQVWDTGAGIPSHELNRIFEDFYRIDITSSGQSGIGLGLAVVNRMVKLLDLNLDVRSKPAKGSVFSLHVPLTRPVQQHSPSRNQGLRMKLNPLHIVCIDDDLSNLRALETLLRHWQINRVDSFVHADELIAYSQLNPAPDVVIVDYHLGNTRDGITVFNQLSLRWPGVTAILVSATPEMALPKKASEHGLMFLSKPIKPATLRACLWQITHR